MAAQKIIAISLLILALFLTPSQGSENDFKKSSVQVGGCGGTLIAKGSEWTYGLSAAHCVGNVGSAARVVFFDGTSAPGEWVSKNAQLDLSLFKLRTKSLPDGAVIADTAPRLSEQMTGFGLNGLKKLKYSETGVINDKTTKVKYLRAEYTVEAGDFDNGDSGGGVFSGNKLSGVISHGEGRKLYAATHEQLLSFVAEQKSLKHKVVTADQWGDKDRTREILALQREIQNLKTQVAMFAAKTGERGPAGSPGPRGMPGPAGPAGQFANRELLESRLEKIEAWIKNFRAVVRVKLIPKGE